MMIHPAEMLTGPDAPGRFFSMLEYCDEVCFCVSDGTPLHPMVRLMIRRLEVGTGRRVDIAWLDLGPRRALELIERCIKEGPKLESFMEAKKA